MRKSGLKWISAFGVCFICLTLLSGTLVVSASEDGVNKGENEGDGHIKHVLLISVDGLHALDLSRYVSLNKTSTLAQLSSNGLTYTSASTSKPSDSFPGILSMTTGGSPNSTGVWYDDSYDRKLSAPGSNCSTTGTEVVYDESIDLNPDALDAGGGIDVTKLPLDPSKGCAPVYPHQFLRVNTIFEVAQQAGKHTAWADKHPAYDLLNGPSGKGVEDLYTPEIASAGGITGSEAKTQAYDSLKVQAILNEIDGKDHTGTKKAPVPAIFGMNFQAVSVGQKLPSGGYADNQGTPTGDLVSALDFVDNSLGKMVSELKKHNLFASTLIIVTAKHGQAPIDPHQLNRAGKVIDNTLSAAGVNAAQITRDDVALIWLENQAQTGAAVTALSANETAASIEKILAGNSLKLLFNDPASDSRVPDVIVLPRLGTIYTTSHSKIAEHGGFTNDDTNIALLVANPNLKSEVIKSPVETYQIAPSILQALGLDPGELKAVRLEKTQLLPGLRFDN